jgi:hypothetical protein
MVAWLSNILLFVLMLVSLLIFIMIVITFGMLLGAIAKLNTTIAFFLAFLLAIVVIIAFLVLIILFALIGNYIIPSAIIDRVGVIETIENAYRFVLANKLNSFALLVITTVIGSIVSVIPQEAILLQFKNMSIQHSLFFAALFIVVMLVIQLVVGVLCSIFWLTAYMQGKGRL